MAEHQAPSAHPVSLPSIHEMFPAHLLRPENEYNSRQKYQETPRTRCSSYPPVHNLAQPRQHSHPTGTMAHDTRLPEYDTHPHAADPRKRPASQIHSFDVLRSDPMNSSLQHLASSPSILNRPSSPQQQHLGSTSSSPAFRVSVPPTAAANIRSPGGQSSRLPVPDPTIPTMISFPVSRPSASNPTPTEDGSDDDNPEESTGKKHICPTCLKRFNRPSSLRIHVNTHTGATPFRCPWIGCGREFNVNSNMRRHYRNHTTPGFSRTQPTDSRRKRRRVETISDGWSVRDSSPSSSYSSPSPPLLPASTPVNGRYPYPYSNPNTKRDYKYNASAPYMHSLADTRVSTALRPAYHS